MPLKFWVEAFLIAVHVINLLPSTSIQSQVPFELLYQKPPNYHLLKPFGCACFPLLNPITNINLSFTQPSVSLLDIVPFNLVTNVYIHLVASTLLGMFSLINKIFLI